MTNNNNPMSLEEVDPELRDVFGKLPSLPLSNRFMLAVIRFLRRFYLKHPPEVLRGVTVSESSVDRAGVRLYRPDENPSGAALLWIHGGGMIMGHTKMNDDLCARYARDLGLVVASVDYRLAPEHPFPAPLDDCVSVWQWLLSHAEELGIQAERIVIAGQSAGGGLAASLAQRLLDEGGQQPAGQLLVYPMLDDRTAADTSLDSRKHLLWNNSMNRFGWSAYLAGEAGREATPVWAVPARRENLAELPPAWIGVGTLDLFLEEDLAYAHRLNDAGVPCALEIAEGAPHGFEALVPTAKVSQEFSASAATFLRTTLGLPSM